MMFKAESPAISLEQSRDYLEKRTRSELVANTIGAVLSFAGGCLVILLIFGVAFMAFALSAMKGSNTWIWAALVVVAFSFIAHACMDPEYLSQLEVRTVDGRAAYNIRLPGGWNLSNVDYLNPKTQQALAKIVLQIITSGPRALAASWRYAKRAAALRRVEPGELAGMFKMLSERGRRIPYEELAGQALRSPEKAFADLLLLDVAQHLPGPPAGMVISSRCREQVTGIKSDGMDF
jgi:hypothetical protein